MLKFFQGTYFRFVKDVHRPFEYQGNNLSVEERRKEIVEMIHFVVKGQLHERGTLSVDKLVLWRALRYDMKGESTQRKSLFKAKYKARGRCGGEQ